MQKGQTGIYITADQLDVHDATVVRVRGGDQVDLETPAGLVQMVNIGRGAGLFEPHGFDPPDAPPPALPQRLVPRYIPTWHAIVLGVPVAGGTAVLCELLWHWLNR